MLLQLDDWLTHIQKVHPMEMDFGLERVNKVALRLNCLEFSCPVITVGGTNGKGSCIALLTSIYSAAGYRTGSFTSPHIIHFNERIQICGEFISDDALCEAFSAIENARGDIQLTYFEFSTLAAFYSLQRATLDVVFLEVGMGGRLDATNCVSPDLALISNIDLDHCQWLGDSRDKIAVEKAGIFREGCPAICGDPQPPECLSTIAETTKAHYHQQAKDFFYELHDTHWEWHNASVHLNDLALPANLHCQNASSVLQAIHCLQSQLPVSEQAIRDGLAQVQLPGRLQWLDTQPRTLCDVAHNPQSIANLANFAQQHRREGRCIAVFSMLIDKAIADAIQPMVALIDEWHIAPLDVPRAAPLEVLESCLAEQEAKFHPHDSILDAYQTAANHAAQDDIIIVFGSFHVISEVLTVHPQMTTYSRQSTL